MAVVNIVSLNFRGLHDENKRRTIFNRYRKSCHILCLQETHCTSKDEEVWTNEWGRGPCEYANGVSTARGVSIMVKKDSGIKLQRLYTDTEGRAIACRVTTDEENFVLINIYGLNKDSPKFFEEQIGRFKDECERLVIVGDFNTTLNRQLDHTATSTSNNNSAADKIKNIMSDLMLHDVWRDRNLTTTRYSWY